MASVSRTDRTTQESRAGRSSRSSRSSRSNRSNRSNRPDRSNRPNRTARGVTTALNYVLVLGMVSLLVSALVLGVGGLVTDEREQSVRAQLDVIGHQFAADLTAAEQLGRHGGGSVQLVADLPREAVGSQYRVDVVAVGGGRYELRLRSATPDVTTVVPFRSRTAVTPTTVRGGPVVVTYTPGGGGTVEVVAGG